MKLAIILPNLSQKGPIIVAQEIVKGLINKVELIDIFYFDNICELNFPCSTFKISFRDKINFDKYDIIHSHMLRPDTYIWMNKKYIKKAICISTLHQDIFQNLSASYNPIIAFIFEKLWLYFLKSQDVIVTLTEAMKNQYSKRIKNVKFTTIYNGRDITINRNFKIDDSDKKLLINVKRKYKILGSLSLLTKRKGIHQIIKVLPFLSNYALVVIGDGKELKKLKSLSKKMGVSDRCFFLGYRLNAFRYLTFFDIYVMSSYSEGFPLGLLEAACYKLPVVCSNIPIFKELFTEGEVSFFDLDNKESLINSIKYLELNSIKMALNIFNKVQEKYSVNIMSTNYLNLYNEVLKISE